MGREGGKEGGRAGSGDKEGEKEGREGAREGGKSGSPFFLRNLHKDMGVSHSLYVEGGKEGGRGLALTYFSLYILILDMTLGIWPSGMIGI